MTSTALITEASRGLGRALAAALNERGWRLGGGGAGARRAVDGRAPDRLAPAAAGSPRPDLVTAIPGDVADPDHRAALAEAIGPTLDLRVNNASDLGPSPLPPLAQLRTEDLHAVLAANPVAPLALIQLTLPELNRAHGRVLDIS